MSAPTLTRGPWAWQKMGAWCLTGQHGMRPIVLTAMKGELTSLVNGLLKPLDTTHPDARLIAAAPTMLEALLAVQKWMGPRPTDPTYPNSIAAAMVIDAVEIAIAKATGQEVPL